MPASKTKTHPPLGDQLAWAAERDAANEKAEMIALRDEVRAALAQMQQPQGKP